MSITLTRRDLEEMSFLSRSFIFLCIMIVFRVIFCPGRCILNNRLKSVNFFLFIRNISNFLFLLSEYNIACEKPVIHGKGVAGARFFFKRMRAGSVDGSIDGADYTEVEQLLQWNGTLSTEISARVATEIQIQIQRLVFIPEEPGKPLKKYGRNPVWHLMSVRQPMVIVQHLCIIISRACLTVRTEVRNRKQTESGFNYHQNNRHHHQ